MEKVRIDEVENSVQPAAVIEIRAHTPAFP